MAKSTVRIVAPNGQEYRAHITNVPDNWGLDSTIRGYVYAFGRRVYGVIGAKPGYDARPFTPDGKHAVLLADTSVKEVVDTQASA